MRPPFNGQPVQNPQYLNQGQPQGAPGGQFAAVRPPMQQRSPRPQQQQQQQQQPRQSQPSNNGFYIPPSVRAGNPGIHQQQQQAPMQQLSFHQPAPHQMQQQQGFNNGFNSQGGGGGFGFGSSNGFEPVPSPQFQNQGPVPYNNKSPFPQASLATSSTSSSTFYQPQQPPGGMGKPQPTQMQQRPGGNPAQSAVPDYFTEFQSSASGQIGMQLGTQALSQGQQYISSNVGRYFDINQWRYYFNVSNSYVLNKLQLLLFPFMHKGWSRIIEQTDDQGRGTFAPPRSDLNAPDLYIPSMSFVTYIIITGIVTGIDTANPKNTNRFSPDVLGLTASSAFFIILFEVVFIKMGNYFLNISSDAPMLELFAYCGYKFIPVCVVVLIKQFVGIWLKLAAFVYFFLAFAFFTLRTLRSVVMPDGEVSAHNETPGAAKKQRIVYLFSIVGVQSLLAWLMV